MTCKATHMTSLPRHDDRLDRPKYHCYRYDDSIAKTPGHPAGVVLTASSRVERRLRSPLPHRHPSDRSSERGISRRSTSTSVRAHRRERQPPVAEYEAAPGLGELVPTRCRSTVSTTIATVRITDLSRRYLPRAAAPRYRCRARARRVTRPTGSAWSRRSQIRRVRRAGLRSRIPRSAPLR